MFCTHLHIDHCGWNTVLRDGRWVPTFPKAKYIFHKREYAAWEEATKRGDKPPGNVWRFNCEPIVAAGQALLVDDDYTLDDTVWLTPTPGHSPCHCCVNIRSRRPARGGDRRHDASRAAVPRAGLVDDLRLGCEAGRARRAGSSWARSAGTGTLILPIHFPHPTVGAGRGRRRAVPLQVRSLNSASYAGSCARL